MKHLLLLFCLVTAPIWAQQTKTIHVLVALCDNKYQGIVPVPKGIGNGQDADSNLYWGCGYGVRTYFKRSKEWKFIKSEKPYSDIILERVTFKHATKKLYAHRRCLRRQIYQNLYRKLLKKCRCWQCRFGCVCRTRWADGFPTQHCL